MHSIIQVLAILLVVLASVCLFFRTSSSDKKTLKVLNDLKPQAINPVEQNFNWEEQKPYPYRPFKKGPHRMTMGIRELDPNDIICLENTYIDRVSLRTKLFEETKQYGCHESAIPALKEAYTFVFGFLLKRYPQYFQLSEKGLIHNIITDKLIPYNPEGLSPGEF